MKKEMALPAPAEAAVVRAFAQQPASRHLARCSLSAETPADVSALASTTVQHRIHAFAFADGRNYNSAARGETKRSTFQRVMRGGKNGCVHACVRM